MSGPTLTSDPRAEFLAREEPGPISEHPGVTRRSIASPALSFGLVSIPVKLNSATESAAALRFKWMSREGAGLRQRYVDEALPLADDPGATTNPLNHGPNRVPHRPRVPHLRVEQSSPIEQGFGLRLRLGDDKGHMGRDLCR